MSQGLPEGMIRIIGTDIGIMEAVVVEVDGEPVCQLHPHEVRPCLNRVMGRMTVTIEFADGQVIWSET
jgi:hypothetical protein